VHGALTLRKGREEKEMARSISPAAIYNREKEGREGVGAPLSVSHLLPDLVITGEKEGGRETPMGDAYLLRAKRGKRTRALVRLRLGRKGRGKMRPGGPFSSTEEKEKEKTTYLFLIPTLLGGGGKEKHRPAGGVLPWKRSERPDVNRFPASTVEGEKKKGRGRRERRSLCDCRREGRALPLPVRLKGGGEKENVGKLSLIKEESQNPNRAPYPRKKTSMPREREKASCQVRRGEKADAFPPSSS